MNSTNSTELIVTEKQVYKDATDIAEYVIKIAELYNNNQLPDNYIKQSLDSNEIYISDSIGGYICFPDPEIDTKPCSTYMKANNYSYRNSDYYLPVQTIEEYHKANLFAERLPIPDISFFTEEYLFQQSVVDEEYKVNCAILFSVLKHHNVPLFYSPWTSFITLLNNLRVRELI